MRRSPYFAGWAVLAMSLAACGNEAPAVSAGKCEASRCAGCCTASGTCEPGTLVAACGLGGVSCVDCGAAGICREDGRCRPASLDAGSLVDSGEPDDAGFDAGASADAGLPADAGTVQDAGEPADAGAGVDAGAPTGESCLDPLLISAGPGTYSGNTSDAADDSQGSCGGASSGDRVYRFHSDQPLDLRAAMTALSGGLQPVLYLRGNSCAGPELGCTAAALAGGEAFVEAGSLPAGDWFLFVDGAAGSQGAYDLELLLTPPLEGDACAAPAPLAFTDGPAGGTAALFGEDTRGMHDDGAASCGGSGGRDRVYAFTIDRTLALQVRVTPDTATFRPVVYLRSSACSSGGEAGCAVASGAGSEALLGVAGLAAGSYYLWVDGASTAGGRFAVEATLSP